MLEDISQLKTLNPTDFILMGGDWNMTPDECEDRWPTKFDSNHFNPIIGEFITKNVLVDKWRRVYPGVK